MSLQFAHSLLHKSVTIDGTLIARDAVENGHACFIFHCGWTGVGMPGGLFEPSSYSIVLAYN
jgi:hypothetical protein